MARPLDGVRVLDLSIAFAGPFGSMMLGDLGAEVLKIEPPEGGDYARAFPPYFLHGDSVYFLSVNRNKKSLALNLKAPAGREILYELVKRSDVVFDNHRPGVLERLGADYATLKAINPRIIYCAISGFGQDGPYRDRPAYDIIIQAMGGGMSMTGEPGGPPCRMGLSMGDLAGGMFATQAVLAALYARERTGTGQAIDLSLLDCQIALLAYHLSYYHFSGKVPEPIGTGHPTLVPLRAFRTKDLWLVIDAHDDHFFVRLCKVLGVPQLAQDPRFVTGAKRLENKQQLHALIEGIFLTKTADEWLKDLIAEGVPAGPVNTVDRATTDAQVLQRNMLITLEHPRGGQVKAAGNPIKLSAMPAESFQYPPALGQHTVEILGGLLGCPQEKIERLRAEGVIAG